VVPDYEVENLNRIGSTRACDNSNIDPSEAEVEAMPKKKTPVRNPWSKDDIRQLKAHSKTRTLVVEVAKKRTESAVRQKAKTIGVGLGHRR
jgi:hypothetical protein